MGKELDELKILVVEDNSNALKLIKLVLGGIGIHQIFTAKDGRFALEFLGEAPELVDLIICDWIMPRMTGLEFLQQVRTVYPKMPFMMVTAKADTSSVAEAKEYAVDAYLTKPYSPQQLERKLVTLVSQL